MSQKRSGKKNSFAKKVKDVIKEQSEIKRVSMTFNNSISTTCADYALDDDIAAGTGTNQRIGHEVRMTSIRAQLYFTCADATNAVRMILYRPKNTFDSLSADAITVTTAVDPDRYLILKDELIPLSLSGSNHIVRKQFNVNLKNLKTRWNTAAAGAPIYGAVNLAFVSDSSASAHPTVQGHMIQYFRDL